jgi:hypothetical protein
MKAIKRILLWDRFPQVLFAIGALPFLIRWATGHHVDLLGAFAAGFNLGSCIYFGMYLRMKKWKETWELRADKVMQMLMSPEHIFPLIQTAKQLVEARQKSDHIDPDKN